MKNIILFLGISLFVTGCNLNQQTNDKNIISVSQYNALTEDISTLIKNQILVNSSTLSIIFDKSVEDITTTLPNVLQEKGYAVQLILPKEMRQEGDTEEMNITGRKVEIKLIPYQEDSFVELNVIIDDVKYSRLYIKKNNTITNVSSWSKGDY